MSRISYVGEKRTLESEFKDLASNHVNVSVGVVVYVLAPNSASEEGPLTATRTNKGIYQHDYYPTQPGRYRYRFQTPNGDVATESSFVVKRSVFDTIPAFPGVIGIATTGTYTYTVVTPVQGVTGDATTGSYSYQGVSGTPFQLPQTPSYNYVGVDGSELVLDMLFYVGTDDLYYTQDALFATPVNKGSLSLSGLDIIDIDRNQNTGIVYGLGSDGRIHSWNDDGTNLQVVVSTGLTDCIEIFIDNKDQRIGISRHQVTAFNYRTYYYSLVGTFLFSHENRSFSTILSRAVHADGDYAYILDTLSNFQRVFRMHNDTGVVEFLQKAIYLSSAGIAVDLPNSRAFVYGGGGIYLYNLGVINNATDAIFQTASPTGINFASAGQMNYFRWKTTDTVVGCSITGSNVWSFDVTTKVYTENRTAQAMKALTTRRVIAS